MTLQQRLETMRAKPEHIRKRYAFWSSFGITAVIFAFWIGSFSSFGATSQAAVASAVSKAGTPAQSLVASVGSFFTDIADIVFGPRKITYPSVEVRAGK
jgi:hypothetical protein